MHPKCADDLLVTDEEMRAGTFFGKSRLTSDL
jgi:hypothetical protein